MSRRFASVFVEPLRALHRDKDVGLIPIGLQERGWDVELHAPAGDRSPWPYPVHAASLQELGSPGYWDGRDLDAVLVWSRLRHEAIKRAVRSAGAPVVVVKADTDGLLSARLRPRETFVVAARARTPRMRPLQVADWLARAGPLHRRELARVAQGVAAADAVVVESDRARDRVAGILDRGGRPDLAGRLHVIPGPVAPGFTRGDVPPERERLVVAVGRWEDPQKNAPLLARALRRFLSAHPEWRAHVVGPDAPKRFRDPGMVSASHVPHEELAALLRRARIVASSSRWESFSLAVHEGLASGCSFAATPLAPFEHAVARGPFGTLATGRGPAALAAALATEAGAWEAGARDAASIARFWRGVLDLDGVAERFETLLGAGQSARMSPMPGRSSGGGPQRPRK